MPFRTHFLTFVLASIFVLQATDSLADNFGVRDARTGTVTDSLFPDPPDCGGDHDVTMWFVTTSFPHSFSPAPWLVVPSNGKIDSSGGSYIDVKLPLRSLSPGNYTGMVFTRCDACTTGRCVGATTVTHVQLQMATQATFGTSTADANFGGLVDGKPVSIHDLTQNVVDEVKDSPFMDLTGAKEIIDRLENAYLDREITSNNLSDVTFVQTVDDISKNGKLGTKIVKVDDEDTKPGDGTYTKFGLMGQQEEIYVGVDMSLKGLTEARKNPGDYYIFTIDGKLGVLNKADFVHTIIHEGFHAYLAGKYNTDCPSGGRGACLEEEQEGFRVGNAAARALGLAEDNTTVGKGYNAGSNTDYETQFPELVPGQEATDPTRKPATPPKSAETKKPKETSALPGSDANPEKGFCQYVDDSLECGGVPNYTLACADTNMSGNGCSLEGTTLETGCSLDGASWSCSSIPPAVTACDELSCATAPATESCFVADSGGYWCDQIPAWGLDCASATECTLTDPMTAFVAERYPDAMPMAGATQSADCSRAGTGEYQPLKVLGRAGYSPAINAEAAPSVERFDFGILDRALLDPKRWPGNGTGPAVDAARLPERGVIAYTPGFNGAIDYQNYSYQLTGDFYSSVNYSGKLDPIPPLLKRAVNSEIRIAGQLFSTTMFPEFADPLDSDIQRHDDSSNLLTNPCRRVLIPVDPNFTRTARNGGNSWGESLDDQWAIKRVGYSDDFDSAWNLLPDDVAPVVVAVIDTGLDWHHADIDPRSVWRNTAEIPDNGIDDDRNGFVDDVIGWNFVSGNNQPWDFDGHGTAVTGIIAAAHNDIGIAGISENARIMVLKGATNFGTTRASWLAEAIVYAVDNDAQIINMSIGGTGQSEMEQAALKYARGKGVLIVAAAGNSGAALDDFSPGGSENVLTVGATHTDNRAAEFSNHGDQLDLVAPGVDVLSLRARVTDANYRPSQDDSYTLGDYVLDDSYLRVSGTSFATPIVSATAALLLGVHPELKADGLMQLLTSTATDIERPGRDKHTGHGMLNPRAALQATPGFSITANISDAALRPAEAPSRVQVTGTVNATGFKRAWVQIGPGENPGAWRFVGQKRKLPIENGIIAEIPFSNFTQSGVWTVVVNVEDRFGVVKKAAAQINIP